MKLVDLNIDIANLNLAGAKDGALVAPQEIAAIWIRNLLENSINQPDPKTGRATMFANLETQRKYIRVLNAVDEMGKDGIAYLEDEDFKFLKNCYNGATYLVQKDVSSIIVQIGNAIENAKPATKKAVKNVK